MGRQGALRGEDEADRPPRPRDDDAALRPPRRAPRGGQPAGLPAGEGARAGPAPPLNLRDHLRRADTPPVRVARHVLRPPARRGGRLHHRRARPVPGRCVFGAVDDPAPGQPRHDRHEHVARDGRRAVPRDPARAPGRDPLRRARLLALPARGRPARVADARPLSRRRAPLPPGRGRRALRHAAVARDCPPGAKDFFRCPPGDYTAWANIVQQIAARAPEIRYWEGRTGQPAEHVLLRRRARVREAAACHQRGDPARQPAGQDRLHGGPRAVLGLAARRCSPSPAWSSSFDIANAHLRGGVDKLDDMVRAATWEFRNTASPARCG